MSRGICHGVVKRLLESTNRKRRYILPQSFALDSPSLNPVAPCRMTGHTVYRDSMLLQQKSELPKTKRDTRLTANYKAPVPLLYPYIFNCNRGENVFEYQDN